MNTIGFRTITRILHSNERALLDKKYADPVTAIKNYPFALAAENMTLGGTDGSVTEADSGIIVKVEVIDIKETKDFVANSKVYNVQLKFTEFPFYQENYVINQKVQVSKDANGWKVSKIVGFGGV